MTTEQSNLATVRAFFAAMQSGGEPGAASGRPVARIAKCGLPLAAPAEAPD